jgi:magnesium transporter
LPPSPGGVGGGSGGRDGQASARDKALPFEFRALEVCLEFSCKSLEQEVRRACCPVRGQRGQITVCMQGSSQLLLSLMFFGIICVFLQTCTLEKEAYPALDELSSNVSTLNLERVRQIKSRLLAISGRVQKVIKFPRPCTLSLLDAS